MAQIVVDDELARQIRESGEPVGLVDREGKAVAVCRPIPQQPHVVYSPEYIEWRRKELEPIRRRAREHPEEGKTLKEIIANLERRALEGA